MKPPRMASPSILFGALIATLLLGAGLLAARKFSLSLALIPLQAALSMLFYRSLQKRWKVSQESLRRSDRYIRALSDLSLDVQSIINAKNQSYVYMNPAVTQMLGHRPEAFLEGGLNFFFSLLHPDDLPQVTGDLEKMLAHGYGPPASGREEFIQEEIYRIRTTWNDYRWFRSRRMVYTRNADGSPRELLVVSRDITDQRGFEIALVQAQELESLGTISRRLAHDLNNILMGIQGYTELGMQEEADPKRLGESLAKIRVSADRATDICRHMLSFGTRGRIQISRTQLNECLKDGLPLVESLLPENIQLVLELGSEIPKVDADPIQIRYALLNLVVNAMESIGTRKGEITIRTGLRRLGEEDSRTLGFTGDFACLEVRDTGRGMSEETLSGLGDPCFRVKHPGRGLGLLTVNGIAIEHHGLLRVESAPGDGTVCRFYLPLANRESPVAGEVEVTPPSRESKVVLLVDDEPSIRAVLTLGLENAGYTVIEAKDGVEGLGCFMKHRSSISLILLDLTMPRMNGDEVFEEIHKIDPNLPVILMSGYSQPEAMAELANKGLADFLSKPCSIKQALAIVQKALGQKSAALP